MPNMLLATSSDALQNPRFLSYIAYVLTWARAWWERERERDPAVGESQRARDDAHTLVRRAHQESERMKKEVAEVGFGV